MKNNPMQTLLNLCILVSSCSVLFSVICSCSCVDIKQN